VQQHLLRRLLRSTQLGDQFVRGMLQLSLRPASSGYRGKRAPHLRRCV
jgi:hypothetical protein